jgi:nucleoside-diphosphate-sugar epimerase
MRVLITGGSGFIGTNLVERFVNRGDDVLNIDIQPPRNRVHEKYWEEVDILDLPRLCKSLSSFNPDVVIHMAARTDLAGAAPEDYLANTEGVSNIILALQPLQNLRLVIFASSMLVCRIGYRPAAEDDYAPSTAYGISKVDGEMRVRSQTGDKYPWIILRPTSIWGPWFGTPYRDFFTVVKRGRYIHPSGRRIRRNYGFVLNSVYQIEKLIETCGADLLKRTIYLADYEPIELKDWACRIQRAFGVREILEAPLPLLWLAAKLGDLLKGCGIKGFPLTSFRLNNLLTDCLLDTTPLKNNVGPLPFDLSSGVEITCNWILSNQEL